MTATRTEISVPSGVSVVVAVTTPARKTAFTPALHAVASHRASRVLLQGFGWCVGQRGERCQSVVGYRDHSHIRGYVLGGLVLDVIGLQGLQGGAELR